LVPFSKAGDLIPIKEIGTCILRSRSIATGENTRRTLSLYLAKEHPGRTGGNCADRKRYQIDQRLAQNKEKLLLAAAILSVQSMQS